MNQQEMIVAVNRRIDDVALPADVVEWLNSGKNQMAIAVGANFPDMLVGDTQATFVFDARYHEAPVLYACASFKEQDSALSEAANFMTKFENAKKDFVRYYVVPPRYRDDGHTQQFTATAGQTTFTVTKEGYSPRYGDLRVYVNDAIAVWTSNPLMSQPNDFILSTPASLGDVVTAIWEEHTDLIDPPYNWMTW